MKKLELQSAIGRQINQATGSHYSEISNTRANLFERYMGEPYGNERANYSSVVSTDVYDVVEWMLPEIMEIFTSGDKVAEFEPNGPEDEPVAEQETDAVNYVFYRQNDGFMAMYEFIKDGLIYKNGYMKRWWETKEETWTDAYKGLDPEELASLQEKYAGELADGTTFERFDIEEGEDGIDVEIKMSSKSEWLRVAALPPEEVLVSPQWEQINLDQCPFVAHRRTMTISDLVEMGYDRKQVERLPVTDDDYENEERVDRFSTKGDVESTEQEDADSTMRKVLVHECYILVDYNDDGIAERRKVTVGGSSNEILKWADGGEDNEEVHSVPISAWCPIPIPHKHYGRSVAETVTDVQRIKTTLVRQMLDNVYGANNATREIARDGIDGENTIKDLLVDRPNKIVRTKLIGNYQEHHPPEIVTQSLSAIEYIDTVRENRTGVNRHNQGLSADSLNKTAAGMEMQLNQGQKKLMLIARVAAETGVRHLFRGIHADLRHGAGAKLKLRLRGEYIDVDPRQWRDRSDMTVNVGIGTGDRNQKAQSLAAIIAEQKENLMQGSPLASPQNLFAAYSRFVENAGFKNPEEFFVDPATIPPAPPEPEGPDPSLAAMERIEMGKANIKVQGDLQRETMRLQAQQAKDAQASAEAANRLNFDIEKMTLEDDRARDQAILEAATKLAVAAQNGEVSLEMETLKGLMAPPPGYNQ